MLSICRLGGCIAEVVDLYLEDLGWTVSLSLGRDVGNVHQIFNGVMGQDGLVVNWCWVRSRAHSVTVQKYDGLSTHPICSAEGTTILIGCPGSCGSTYAKL